MLNEKKYILAFDTANETIAIGIAKLNDSDAIGTREFSTKTNSSLSDNSGNSGSTNLTKNGTEINNDPACLYALDIVYSECVEAHRSSNTKLLPMIDDAFSKLNIHQNEILCVVCGRGPGSFTGVRICMATAKGIAHALGVSLVGVSTLDAIAWNIWSAGHRGKLFLLADAMRHEIYPAMFNISDVGVARITVDTVMKADIANINSFVSLKDTNVMVAGDGLNKYLELLSDKQGVKILDKCLWLPTGLGLLLAFEHLYKQGLANPFDNTKYNPAYLLPVYTRLSDAEENERLKLLGFKKDVVSKTQNALNKKNLNSGVQGNNKFLYRPMGTSEIDEVVDIELASMGSDTWNKKMFENELAKKNSIWWVASDVQTGKLVGYIGAIIAGECAELLKVAVSRDFRCKGIATHLIVLVAQDARNLAADEMYLEVRESNVVAQKFYTAIGFVQIAKREKYYSDKENAICMQCLISEIKKDVAGMQLERHTAEITSKSLLRDCVQQPLIFAIESSCDETGAAIIDGTGRLLSDVVASQVDFHSRFGGVVPEIASRKHIEAICGVCDECFDVASKSTEQKLSWQNIDCVAVTYAPGLVGALVVGVAFAKGAAWAIDRPFIGINHLEGHLYANKCADVLSPIEFPAVASLVSGGNTMLVEVRTWGEYKTLGSTIDDAVGEAFDKVAKALGLGYPGGPIISALAKRGDACAISFPRAMINSKDFNFSLSGLKTAVVTYIDSLSCKNKSLSEKDICDIAASFQAAVIDVQVSKARDAIVCVGAKEFWLGGGVAANESLRQAYTKMCDELGVTLRMAPNELCGDNAAMIALVALDKYKQGKFFSMDADAYANASLDDISDNCDGEAKHR